MTAAEQKRENERAKEAGRNAGRAGKGANDNPWRNSSTNRHLRDAWEEGRGEARAERSQRR